MLVYQDQESGKIKFIDSEEELENKDLYAYIHCYGCDIDILPNVSDKPQDIMRAWNNCPIVLNRRIRCRWPWTL